MEVLGLKIETDSSVYEPDEDSALAARVADSEIGAVGRALSVLDMGCGSGVIGLHMAMSENVDRVVLADASSSAVALCKRNLELNLKRLHAKCEVIKSDLFDEIDEDAVFDIIVFNAPYLAEGAQDDLSNAWYGGEGGIEISVEFLKQAYVHLNSGGSVVLLASSLSDTERLYDAISQQGFLVEKDASVHINFEDIIALVIKKQAVIGS